jgi:hypothetical protein
MSKVALMAALFDQFTGFITELTEMYPNEPHFSFCLRTVQMLKSTNPSIVIKYIVENTLEYEEKIMNKDESFFLAHEFAEHKENVDMNIFESMKTYFKTMTPDTKESVWKYCQNIIRLAKACQAMGAS